MSNCSPLPNRQALHPELERMIASAHEDSERVALLLLHLPATRRQAILHGYPLLETWVAELYQRLSMTVRERDIIVRTSESEFAVVIPSLFNEGHLLLAINKLLRELNDTVEVEGQRINTELVIGAAYFPDHADSSETLLQCADIALLEALEQHRTYQVFEDRQLNRVTQEWTIAEELEQAYVNGELSLHYQPKIILATGEPYGVEALMRWQSPTRGFVSPEHFIAVAEQSGQITQLTWWVLNTALREAEAWPEMMGSITVAVNVSASMLNDPEFVDTILSVANIWGGRERLTVEVTEGALMQDQERSLSALRQLQEAGIHISIDDFGTGYSSLSYFKDIPAHELKIDKSFVMNMLQEQGDADIVKTVIDLAHRFELTVVAEGVEDQVTFNALVAMGCDYGQGFFMGRPMPKEGLIDWFNEYNPSSSSTRLAED